MLEIILAYYFLIYFIVMFVTYCILADIGKIYSQLEEKYGAILASFMMVILVLLLPFAVYYFLLFSDVKR